MCPNQVNRDIQKAGFTLITMIVIAAALGISARCGARVNVLTQHNNLNRTGSNLQETILTPEKVNDKQFGMLFKRVLDDQVYSRPLITPDIEIGGAPTTWSMSPP